MSKQVVSLRVIEALEKELKRMKIWTANGDTREEEIFKTGALFGYRLNKNTATLDILRELMKEINMERKLRGITGTKTPAMIRSEEIL